MLISVIVPAYNTGPFLRPLLDSVLAQSEPGWECVIVDDGSKDDTLRLAQEYGRRDERFIVIAKENGGASSARNAGFRASSKSSKYVTFMDSDDVWFPNALELLLARLVDDPQAIGSHGLGEYIDESGAFFARGEYPAIGRSRLGLEGKHLIAWPLDRPTEFDVLINGNVLFPPGLVLAHRAAYEQVGPFDESFNGPEDWDMLIRLSRMGYISFVDEVILGYRRHGSNLGAAPGIAEKAWLVRCKAFHSPENSQEQQERARRGWRAYQRMMMRSRLRTALTAVREREPAGALPALARIPVHLGRYARGYPLPKVVRPPLRW